ncbi:MAG: YraN family protein [Clostridia bacterium]|nr:YraN family protein [Clostridia bacterium]
MGVIKGEEDKRTVKQRKGDWGEDKAAELLESKGYALVCRKFRSKLGEVDIVARKGRFLAFVEVKTRKRVDFGLPCEAVDGRKQYRLRKTAEYFMLVNPWTRGMQPRMDIIEILCLDQGNYIRHLENAF